MIRISKITYKNSSVRCDLDDGEKLEIPIEIISQYSLSSGKDLTKDEYLQLKEESERFRIRERALSYLAIRNRSHFELVTYLRKKGFSEYLIEEIMQKISEAGYINDYSFAVEFIKGKMNRKTVGRDILFRDLMRRGVKKSVIQKAIKECGADTTDENAVFELAEKKYRSLEGRGNRKEKVGNFLRSRGFDFDTIRSVLDRLDE